MKKMIFIILTGFFISGCSKTEEISFMDSNRKEFVIGHIKTIDLTTVDQGSDPNMDDDGDIALKASIDYINESGIFPFKFKIKTFTFQDISNPKTVAKNVKEFEKEITKAFAWVGSTATAINLAIAPISIKNLVPLSIPISSKSFMTQGYKNIYQMTPTNMLLGYKTWDMAREIGVKNTLIIKDDSDFYDYEYAQAFLDNNKIHNNPIKTTVFLGSWIKQNVNKDKLKEEIRELLKNGSFDSIFFPGRQGDINIVMKIIESLGMLNQITLLTGDEGSYQSIFQDIRGTVYVNFIAHFPVDFKPELNPKMAERLKVFNKFYSSVNINNLSTAQHFFLIPLFYGEVLAKVLEANQDFYSRDSFYEIFNNVAKSKEWNGYLDGEDIRFDGSGAILPDTVYHLKTSFKGTETIARV